MDRDESKQLGLPESTGLFSELFGIMEQEIKSNKGKSKEYGDAINMTAFDKKISFLNRYFVYKKMREVNISKIQLEMSEYNADDTNKNKQDTKQAVEIARKTSAKLKPVVKKLPKKIILKQIVVEPEIEQEIVELELEPIIVPIAVEKPKKTAVKGRKKLIIHDA
jgi:hypothetical protein